MVAPHLIADIPHGDWVALTGDQTRVLEHGPDLGIVIKRASEYGEASPFITRVTGPIELLAIFRDA